MSAPPSRQPHIVVLGAGFAGIAFVKAFPRRLARITVVDRTNHHLFQPLLYQVATAGLAVPDIAEPVRSMLSRREDVAVLMAEVVGIDLSARQVRLSHGTLPYDYLVIALGGRTTYFGHPEWEAIAPGLKTIDDAIRIRREALGHLEEAEATGDPGEQRRLTTAVVIGGGPTGVELAGALAELHRHVLARDFRRVNLRDTHIVLVEGGPRLLAAFPPSLSEKTRQQLEELGVTVLLNTPVRDMRPGEVVLEDKTIAAATIIWAAGVGATPLTAQLGGETDRAGRVKVLPDLSLPGHPEVFALGDMVALVDTRGVAVPGVSPAAMQMGRHVARHLAREIRAGASPAQAQRMPFIYRDKGSMATIGRSRAVAKIGRLEFSGLPAWILWLFVHLVFLISFRSKLSVLLQWAYSYIVYKRGARVIYGGPAADPD